MTQDSEFGRRAIGQTSGRGTGRSGSMSRPSDERTYEELYQKAKRHNIKGRSKMSKTELERALGGR